MTQPGAVQHAALSDGCSSGLLFRSWPYVCYGCCAEHDAGRKWCAACRALERAQMWEAGGRLAMHCQHAALALVDSRKGMLEACSGLLL